MGFFGNMFGGQDRGAGRRQIGQAGSIAGGVASQARPLGQQYDAGASESMGTNAGEYMQNAQNAANQFAEGQATGATKMATQAARTAGLNKGQAALAGTQRAGDVYTGAQGQGINNYMGATREFANQGSEMANRQLGAAGIKAGIGAQQLQAGQQQQNATLGAIGNVAGAGATMLGEGGIVSEPTLAVVGEKGPEVVIQLEKLRAMLASIRGEENGNL